jgi:hypothetical protein
MGEGWLSCLFASEALGALLSFAVTVIAISAVPDAKDREDKVHMRLALVLVVYLH